MSRSSRRVDMTQEAAAAEETMTGSSVAPAGTDQLDLEAAEQLIQLSGGDGGDDDGGGSESRSADSVKCRGKKDKEAAVESRRRSAGRPVAAAGKDDGDGGGESDSKVAAESFACSTAAGVEEKDKAVVVECRRRSAGRSPVGKDRDGGIVHGEARRRPKFRSLAAIYRETEPSRLTLAGGGGEEHADRDPSEGERKKKKRAADEVIPADAEASKETRFGAISAHAYVS